MMPYGAENHGPLDVLLIDDDETLGVLVGKRLGRRGHRVVVARSGDEGVSMLSREEFDVIALDHSLPGETGVDVLKRLGPRAQRPPVVYVTGSADARVALEALRAGADEYVIKDMSGEFFELLAGAIEHVFDRWRMKKLREEQEQAVRDARDRAELLLKEVNHRVANSLGLVAAMVRMQAGGMSDPNAVKALQETQARISAIAGVHRRLYTSERIGIVSLDDYLAHFVGELQASLQDASGPHRIALKTDRIEIATDKAISLGVMVGELATNAFKYAYAPAQVGEVRISLQRRDEGHGRLIVEDDGCGFDPDAVSAGTGLGSKILQAMARSLNATLAHDPAHKGARIVVEFPFDERAHSAP
jgi:two-component sensor histidine kinase/ActR/RegA family two-component response regulator